MTTITLPEPTEDERRRKSPHDLFAKYTFGKKERAVEELRGMVGPTISALIDWDLLEADPTELSDQVLGRTFPDLRWSSQLSDREVRLNFVFEHQSAADPLMPVRFFCHTGAIWNSLRHETPARIPLVLNVLLHNGASPWKVPELWSAIDGGAWYHAQIPGALPHLPIFVDDLAAVSDEQILARPQSADLRLALLAMKHTATRDAVPMLQREPALVAEASEDMMRYTVGYVLEADPGATMENVVAAVRGPLGSRGVEMAMTVGDRLRQEGETKGKRALLFMLLDDKGVSLTPSQRQEIETCEDPVRVDRWFKAALHASSADEVFVYAQRH
jgi:hypothetical protein